MPQEVCEHFALGLYHLSSSNRNNNIGEPLMISFFEALATNPLLLSAVIAGLAASVVSGIIGSYVVVKRIVFISGSISHSVLSGIGFCLWLERAKGIAWVSPLYGALIAAIALRFDHRMDSS